jgi:hypothetical protein
MKRMAASFSLSGDCQHVGSAVGRSRMSWVGSENTIEALDCLRFVLLACLQDAHQLCEAFSRHLSGLPWRHLQPEMGSVAGAEVAVQGNGSTLGHCS